MGTNVCEEAKLKCFLLRLKKNNSETSRSGMELVNVGILSRKIPEGADGEYETDRSVKNPRSYRGAKEEAQLRATGSRTLQHYTSLSGGLNLTPK